MAQLQNKLYNCKKNAQWQFSFVLIMVSVVYHPNTGHLASIGKLPALAG
jgi:hypothetical protein